MYLKSASWRANGPLRDLLKQLASSTWTTVGLKESECRVCKIWRAIENLHFIEQAYDHDLVLRLDPLIN